MLCLVGDSGKIVIFAIFASIANFYGPPHCFVLCLVGDSGKIVIFAIFAKFASIANFYGASSLLCALPCWRFWQNCHFCHICQIRHYVLFFAIFVDACISGHISSHSGGKTTSSLQLWDTTWCYDIKNMSMLSCIII